MTGKFKAYIDKENSIAPLVIFRVLFGIMMMGSILRFWLNGWIYEQYIAPTYFFSYYGFEFVSPLGENGMYGIFALMLIAALGITLGAFYRVSALLFFVAFTYVELIDKSNYLNHYYFVSLVSFLMIWLPAHKRFSIDSLRKGFSIKEVPVWTIDIIKLQLAIVYFYAGLAKVNGDWLLEAMPLKIWLPVNDHLPIIGGFLDELWIAYFFSWFGAIYDLTIPFFLLKNSTRPWAYIAVVTFHILTWLLFPIGMFPFIMIISTLIFFSNQFHERLLRKLERIFQMPSFSTKKFIPGFERSSIVKVALAVFIIFQLVFPWRYLLYPGNLFWTEEGFRFSWRVMLIEKAGYVTFHVKDPETGREGEVYPEEFLTPNQEKQMSTQPDMIWQFAHYIEELYKNEGIEDPEVRAEAYVTLNGNGSKLIIDPTVDLTKEKDDFSHKKWILSE